MISGTATLLLGVLAATNIANVEVYEFTAPWCGGCQKMKPTVSRLEQAGVTVHQVQFDKHRQMAEQAGVDRLPTFVVISDGRELDRIVGGASFDRLYGMVERASEQVALRDAVREPPRRSPAVVRGQQEANRKGIGSALANLMDRVRDGDATTRAAAPPSAPAKVAPAVLAVSDAKVAEGVANASFQGPMASRPAVAVRPEAKDSTGDAAVDRAMKATVLLRVADPEGVSLGTGTIIDVHDDEALILTCGHIFEDSKGKGGITCDLDGGFLRTKLPAKLISYDARRDVGLVSVRPGRKIEPIAVSGPGYRPREGDRVFSIGCNHGDPATIIRNEVLAVNRYHGPANLVVGGRPVNGRSGGGLFDSQGRLIGVCNAADQEKDEGLYASLGPIHAELDSSGLGFIYRPNQPSLASLPGVSPGSRTTNDSDPVGSRRSRGSSPANSIRSNPSSAIPGSTSSSLSGSESEVICIVRPKRRSESGTDSTAGQAYVLEHPSPALLNQLSQELAKRGPHAMTGQREPEPLRR